ncbi:MAG: ChbG/HpnK family deacetylase [Promethearchaeota archaeon]
MNYVLEKLGYSDKDRVVIFHTDDIGFCRASFEAYVDLVDFGLISAASTLVPCPSFKETAEFCKKNPKKVDMGVHLTGIGEFNTKPLSIKSPDPRLTDKDGCFYRENEIIFDLVDSEVMKNEIQAQVDLAVTSGIDITHVDSHCGTHFNPKFSVDYIDTALKFKVPPLLFRPPEMKNNSWQKKIDALEGNGVPIFDNIVLVSLEEMDNKKDRIKGIKKMIDGLKPGLTYFIIHPAKNTVELKKITTDWKFRVADYLAFTDPELKKFVNIESGIYTIGYKVLRDTMRKNKK